MNKDTRYGQIPLTPTANSSAGLRVLAQQIRGNTYPHSKG